MRQSPRSSFLILLLITFTTLIASFINGVSAVTVSTSTYENCGGSTHLTVHSAQITYQDGNKDANYVGTLFVVANGWGDRVSTDIVIASGGAVITASILGHDFSLERDDFCSLTNCPLGRGEYTLVKKNVSVSIVPPPGVEVQVRILVQNGPTLLGCFNIRFDFDYTTFTIAVTTVALVMFFLAAIMGAISVINSVVKSIDEAQNGNRASELTSVNADGTPFDPTTYTGPNSGVHAAAVPVSSTGIENATGTSAAPAAAPAPGPSSLGGAHLGSNATPANVPTGSTSAPSTMGGSHMGTLDPNAVTSTSNGPSTLGGTHLGSGAVDPNAVTTTPTNASTLGGPQLGGADPNAVSTAPTNASTLGGPQLGGADPNAVSANPTGPSSLGGPGLGGADPNAVSATPTGPSTLGGPHLGGADPTAVSSDPTAASSLGGHHLGSTDPHAVSAAPVGPSTLGAPHLGGADPVPVPTGAPSNLGGPHLGGATSGGGTAGATSTVTVAPSGTQTVESSPWFFDIIHYFQFITLTGQLQLDYPAVFSTFTRLFHFANGGFQINFIQNAIATWTGVSNSDLATRVDTNNTTPQSLKDLTSASDVGLTAFVLQSGVEPANFFPTTLITLVFMVGVMVVLTALIMVCIEVWGVFKNRDLKGLEERQRKKIMERKRKVLARFFVANIIRSWMIAQYPLTMASTYWISNFATSSLAPASITAVASISFACLCILLPASALFYILYIVKPKDRLFTDNRLKETLGPLYDHLKPSVVWFAAVQLAYYGAQGLLVGAFPRTTPRKEVETLLTWQWTRSLVQPILLVFVEIAFMVLFKWKDPFSDAFSGRLQFSVSWARLMVLLIICTFAVPQYKKQEDGTSIVTASDVENSYTGASVWTFKDVMAYLAGLCHAILLLGLLALIIRKIYLWARDFIKSRKDAAKTTGSRGRGAKKDKKVRISTVEVEDGKTGLKGGKIVDEESGDGHDGGVDSVVKPFLVSEKA
ncbi:hypothetical protein HDU76_006645 [Blyttiomyces sp. JEL0837]|nr:hypothetical protein HDU76_006645 [Blyttiomyces sp. JEL0837]